MSIYTIATSKHTVAGHGDSYDSYVIQKMGWYESGDYPPYFLTKAEAELYLEKNRDEFLGAKVVELRCADEV